MKKASSDSFRIILGDPARAEITAREIAAAHDIADFDKKTLYADTVSAEELLQELEFLPVVSAKRLVAVKNIENFTKDAWEKIFPWLEKPAAHVFLIMSGQSAKVKLTKFSPSVGRTEKTPEAELFSFVYRKADLRQTVEMFHSYLTRNEKGYIVVTAALEILLRNKFLRGRIAPKDMGEKLRALHNLDFSLKTGRITPQAGIELFLAYLLT